MKKGWYNEMSQKRLKVQVKMLRNIEGFALRTLEDKHLAYIVAGVPTQAEATFQRGKFNSSS